MNINKKETLDKQKLHFWATYLSFIGIVLAVFGGLLSYTPFMHFTLGTMYYDNYFEVMTYHKLNAGELNFQRFVYGATGGVITSWGIFIAAIARYALKKGEPWAWNTIALTTFLWFLGDGYASVISGFPVHALMNIGVLIFIVLPLIAIYNVVEH
ncbi:hypothetical protein [Aureispira anguillae]|uniref:Uncharacterized protein n=1 Tax=Aureispira anguillae TaxID=2864201 RepID=A0A915VMH0_9BACT|nr:hypothetical protein [Aureispira anguillae]BDS09460.1 hypothetical protein AsAng_0001580 [Aureispira anguillae]